MAASGRYIPPALKQREEEKRRREREQKGKAVVGDRMERLAMISRSGSEGNEGDTLKDYKVQEEFREYIQKHITSYKTTNPYPPPLLDDGTSSLTSNQRETLTNILIMFRKLREGILAAQRVDAFAVESYESSAELAVYCQEEKALASVFGRLVPGLYEEHLEATLAQALSMLKMNRDFRAREDGPMKGARGRRDEYTAVYLLHLLLIAYPSQREFLPRLRTLLPRTTSEYHLVATTAAYVRRNNFSALSRLTLQSSATGSDMIHRMLVSILAKTRLRTWATLRAAYMQLQLDRQKWLCSALGLGEAASVEQFMRERAKVGEVVEKAGAEKGWTVVKANKAKT